MWLMKILLTAVCINQRGAGQYYYAVLLLITCEFTMSKNFAIIYPHYILMGAGSALKKKDKCFKSILALLWVPNIRYNSSFN